MRSRRSTSRLIPHWQTGCIDSKWRWMVPWGSCGLVVLAISLVSASPWMLYSLERSMVCELKFRLADQATATMPGTTVIRITSDLQIQIDEATLLFPRPQHPRDMYNLQTMHDLQTAVQREIKKMPRSPTIVLRVNPQVRLEIIAVVWTSIEAASKATLYLDVTSREPSGPD